MHVTLAVIQMSWKHRTAKANDEIQGKVGRQALINEMYKYEEEVDGNVRKKNNSYYS